MKRIGSPVWYYFLHCGTTFYITGYSRAARLVLVPCLVLPASGVSWLVLFWFVLLWFVSADRFTPREPMNTAKRLAKLVFCAVVKWIFAVSELDDAAVDILDNAIASLTRQPSRRGVMMIVWVTKELNRIVEDSR